MLYYSCEMLCCNSLIEMLIRFQKDLQLEEIKRFRKSLIKFKSNSDRFINFVQENKKIKGFQDINYRELNPFDRDQIVAVIDRILRDFNKEDHQVALIPYIDYTGEEKMKVEKKPSVPFDKKIVVPRIRHLRRRSSALSPILSTEYSMPLNKSEANPFSNWINSYS